MNMTYEEADPAYIMSANPPYSGRRSGSLEELLV